jgi:hypothetical protein
LPVGGRVGQNGADQGRYAHAGGDGDRR